MNLTAAILAAALALPPPVTPGGHEPEPRPAYEARIGTIAQAISDVSRTREEAATLLVIMYDESRFDRFIHAGERHPIWTQDHGRARCLAQLHATGQVPEWATLAGTDLDSTRRCAGAAIRVLRSAAHVCTSGKMTATADMARVFEAYANSGVQCSPSKRSAERAARWERLRTRLWAYSAREGRKTAGNSAR